MDQLLKSCALDYYNEPRIKQVLPKEKLAFYQRARQLRPLASELPNGAARLTDTVLVAWLKARYPLLSRKNLHLKHGFVQRAVDWPYSTFHRYVEQGIYPLDWACGLDFDVQGGERG